MKITIEEVLTRQNWLHEELMHSLDQEVIDRAKDNGGYEVKLLVNGKELEPKLLIRIIDEYEKLITEEAKIMLKNKFDDINASIDKLKETIDEIDGKVMDEFDKRMNEQ